MSVTGQFRKQQLQIFENVTEDERRLGIRTGPTNISSRCSLLLQCPEARFT